MPPASHQVASSATSGADSIEPVGLDGEATTTPSSRPATFCSTGTVSCQRLSAPTGTGTHSTPTACKILR